MTESFERLSPEVTGRWIVALAEWVEWMVNSRSRVKISGRGLYERVEGRDISVVEPCWSGPR